MCRCPLQGHGWFANLIFLEGFTLGSCQIPLTPLERGCQGVQGRKACLSFSLTPPGPGCVASGGCLKGILKVKYLSLLFPVLFSQPKRDFLSSNVYAAVKARMDFSREKVSLPMAWFFLRNRKEAACHMEYPKSTPKSPPSIWVTTKINITISGCRRPQACISGHVNTAFQCIPGPRDTFWDLCEKGVHTTYSSSWHLGKKGLVVHRIQILLVSEVFLPTLITSPQSLAPSCIPCRPFYSRQDPLHLFCFSHVHVQHGHLHACMCT